ncbi:hypothetical protein ABPG74_018153 [Tetrahymena malaccensis]
MISDITSKKPQFGEIFITNDEVGGSIEQLKHFRGKLVTNISGGFKKLFVIEEGHFNEGLVSTLHAPEYDDYDYTFTDEARSVKNLEDIFQGFNDKGQIKKMVCGKKHTVFITEDGRIYTYGIGEYGSLGHGGILQLDIPKNILKLQEKKIIQVACGEFHTLALTETFDLYSWGRGFEGQLGTGKDSSSVPCYVKFFYEKYDMKNGADIKKRIKYITCGAYHSLAITDSGQLYSWGEARLGQTGTGKKKSEPYPVIVNLNAQPQSMFEKRVNTEQNQMSGVNKIELEHSHDELKINPIPSSNQNNQKVVCVSGGYGHTVAITEEGELYSWGFNTKGQLGMEGTKSLYYPQRVKKDILGNELPLFASAFCGYNNTFAIDVSGNLWSWGGGNLGQKNDHFQDLPRKITENVQNRKFTEMCITSNSGVFFAPMRIMSVRPNYSPSCGGTLISLLGTGFAETAKQSIRFKFGKYQLEVGLQYDGSTESFYCQTPKFDDASEDHIEWPLLCTLEITLDGVIYTQCEESFLIYSSKIQMTSIEPKCASVEGGTELTLHIQIDDLTASYLKHLTVGFQSRSKKEAKKPGDSSLTNSKRLGAATDQTTTVKQDYDTPMSTINSKNRKGSITQAHQNQMINPLDIEPQDPELEKENWICVVGKYDKGKITCTVPTLTEFNNDSLNYNVDVSLNGQQFTGQPSSFRFYDVHVSKLEPNNDALSGGARCKLMGEGFFDTLSKRIMFKSKYGERLIDINWDKKERSFTFIAPPINWLLGGQDPTPELIKEVQSNKIDVALTLNGVQWIHVADFQYAEAQITRIGSVPDWEKTLNEQDIQARWNAREPIVDPLQGLTEAEQVKKKEELRKLLELELYDLQYFYKKTGQYLYIHGEDFIDSPDMIISFIFNNTSKIIKGVYKNSSKIGVIIPELDQVPQGIHDVTIEISYNGQCFSNAQKTFRYYSFKDVPLDQRAKIEDAELKNLKKNAPKPPK